MLGLLVAVMTAGAAESELSFDLSLVNATGRSWERVAEYKAGPTMGGARVGIAVAEPLVVLADWHFGRRGFVYDETDSSTHLQLAHHRGELGVKLAPTWNLPLISPYAAVEGALVLATMRVDDDHDSRLNANQFVHRSLVPGGYGALGFDLAPDHDFNKVGFGAHLEFGYQAQPAYDFGVAGRVAAGGWTARLGMGVRF